MKITIKQLKIY